MELTVEVTNVETGATAMATLQWQRCIRFRRSHQLTPSDLQCAVQMAQMFGRRLAARYRSGGLTSNALRADLRFFVYRGLNLFGTWSEDDCQYIYGEGLAAAVMP